MAFGGEAEQRVDLFLHRDVAGQGGDAVRAELLGQGGRALPSLRAWASPITIRAPSSRNLRAVAPPIPAPAAAVITAVRPARSECPAT